MAEFTITEDLYWRAVKLSLNKRLLITSIACFLFVLISVLLFFDSRGGIDWGAFAPYAIILLAIFISIPTLQRWQVKRIYAQQKSLHVPIQLKLTDEALEWSFSSKGNAHVEWSDIYRWKSNKEITLIYESQAIMRIVPNAALSDSEMNFLAKKLQNVRKA